MVWYKFKYCMIHDNKFIICYVIQIDFSSNSYKIELRLTIHFSWPNWLLGANSPEELVPSACKMCQCSFIDLMLSVEANLTNSAIARDTNIKFGLILVSLDMAWNGLHVKIPENYFKILEEGKNVGKFIFRRNVKIPENEPRKRKNPGKFFWK